MLSYYRPGLDVSTLTEQEFIIEIAHLIVIRRMEQQDQVNKALKGILK